MPAASAVPPPAATAAGTSSAFMAVLPAFGPFGLFARLLLPAFPKNPLRLQPVDESEVLCGHLSFRYCFDFDALAHPNLLSLTQSVSRVDYIVRCTRMFGLCSVLQTSAATTTVAAGSSAIETLSAEF